MSLLSSVCVLFLISTIFATPHHKEGHSHNEDADVNFNEYRLDAATNKYQRIGNNTSCKPNMRFFAVPDESKLGICDCDKRICSRPLIFSPITLQCHWAWSQGPCAPGEWFTFDAQLTPLCEKNPCPTSTSPEGTIKYYFKNPSDGKCYETGTKGYCTGENRLMTVPYKPIPECRTATVCYPLTRPETQECIPGNRRTYDGFC